VRKLNALVTAALAVLIVWHGLSGSFMLLELNAGMSKCVAWSATTLAALHAVLSLWLGARTIKAARGGKLYLRQNARFWAVRVSGIALIFLLVLHMGAFGRVRSGQFVLFEFTAARFAVELAMAAALAVHALAGLGPLLVSLGVPGWRSRHDGALLFLAALLLFFAAALTVYYLMWQWL